MKKALTWLASHWYIPILALVGFVGFVIGARSRNPSPLAMAKGELEAIDAGEKARLLEAEKGRDAANAAADLEYREALNGLDDRQRRKVETLRRDPGRRARYLARISGKRPGDAI